MARQAVKKVGLRATSGKRTLAFGLLRVGVGMAPMLHNEKRIAGNLICPEHSERVKRTWRCGHDHDVADPVKAYAYGGQYVVLEDGEVPRGDDDGLISLEANIPAREVYPAFVEKTYLIWPEDATHDQGYQLALTYLRDNDRAFIGTTVAEGTTKAFAVRYSVVTRTLVAHLLSYASLVRWENVKVVEDYLDELPAPDAGMLKMAGKLFGALPDTFRWDSIHDEYGERLEAAIAAKAATGSVPTVEAATTPKPAMDLMDALKASVEAAEAEKAAKGKRKKVAA